LAGKVTIATNMAGRGTDIQLGSGVAEVGGLYVLGTERHESRRIDNQLRGRSGRQGDPGESQFYISLEDDLMRIFGGPDRIMKWMDRMGVKDDEVISHSMVNRAIAGAQKRVEGQNYEVRKHLLEYDDVLNKQRTVVYRLRRRILKGEEIQDEILMRLDEAADLVVSPFAIEANYPETWELEKFYAEVKRSFAVDYKIPKESLQTQTAAETAEQIAETIKVRYAEIEKAIGSETMRDIERQVLLGVIDLAWREHLYAMDGLRDATRFRGYAQKDPLQEYKKEGFALFGAALERIALDTVQRLLHIDPDFLARQQQAMIQAREQEARLRAQLQFSAPGEPGGGVQAGGQGGMTSTPIPQFSTPQVSGGRPQAPLSGPMPGTVVPRAPQAIPAAHPAFKDVGRNDPCPCGSGKKFKKCHGEGI